MNTVSGLRVRTALAALLGVALAGIAHPALACSPPLSGWTFFGARGPANGVIWTTVACYDDCSPVPGPSAFTMTGPNGNVPGTVTVVESGNEHHFLFKPDAPLTAGQAYSVTVAGAEAIDELPPGPTVTVIPTEPVTWSATPSVMDEVIALNHPSGTRVCCSGPEDSCGDLPCFHEETERVTAVSVKWDVANVSAVERGQYEYRVIRDTDPNPAWSYPFSDVVLELSEAEDSVCYALELRRVVDGVVHQYPERCIERPADFGDFGILPIDPQALAGALAACDAPPAGYLDPWCSANQCAGKTTPECSVCAGGAGGATGEGGGAGTTGGDGGSGAIGGGGTGATGGDVAEGGNGATGGDIISEGTAGEAGAAGASSGGTSFGGHSQSHGGAVSVAGGTSQGGGTTSRGGATSQGGRTSGSGGDGANAAGDSGDFERDLRPDGCACSTPGGNQAPAPYGLVALGAMLLLARRRKA